MFSCFHGDKFSESGHFALLNTTDLYNFFCCVINTGLIYWFCLNHVCIDLPPDKNYNNVIVFLLRYAWDDDFCYYFSLSKSICALTDVTPSPWENTLADAQDQAQLYLHVFAFVEELHDFNIFLIFIYTYT